MTFQAMQFVSLEREDDFAATLQCTHPGAGEICKSEGRGLMVAYLLGDDDFCSTPGVWIACDDFWKEYEGQLVVKLAFEFGTDIAEEVAEELRGERAQMIAAFVDDVNRVNRSDEDRGATTLLFVDRYDDLIESLTSTQH